jgi:hypothetical protein
MIAYVDAVYKETVLKESGLDPCRSRPDGGIPASLDEAEEYQ